MDTVTAIAAFNSLMSLVIIYFLLPLWKLKGQLKGLYTIIESHEERIQSLEKNSRR